MLATDGLFDNLDLVVFVDEVTDWELEYFPQEGGGVRSIYNPGIGQYDISITTGPSYNTKRMEAAATFVEMAKGAADPASASVLRYLVMRNSDSAGADEAAKLLKTMLPPQALQALDSKEPIPPQVQAQMQQMQQRMQQMSEAGQKLQQENVQLKAGVAKAQIETASDQRIEAMRLQAEAAAEQMRLQAEGGIEQMRLQMERRDEAMRRMFEEREAKREADFRRWEALLEARTDVVVAKINAENRPEPALSQ